MFTRDITCVWSGCSPGMSLHLPVSARALWEPCEGVWVRGTVVSCISGQGDQTNSWGVGALWGHRSPPSWAAPQLRNSIMGCWPQGSTCCPTSSHLGAAVPKDDCQPLLPRPRPGQWALSPVTGQSLGVQGVAALWGLAVPLCEAQPTRPALRSEGSSPPALCTLLTAVWTPSWGGR